jgi:hypothetical protein
VALSKATSQPVEASVEISWAELIEPKATYRRSSELTMLEPASIESGNPKAKTILQSLLFPFIGLKPC